MDIVALTPGLGTTSGWKTFSKAVLERLQTTDHVTLVDDLPSPLAMQSSPTAVLKATQRVRALAKDADIVYSFIAYPYSLVAYLATRWIETPYVVSCHGTYAVRPLHTKHRVLATRALWCADRLFPVSEFTAAQICETLGQLETITVVPNGVDQSPNRAAPFDIDAQVLLTVGSIKPRKGHHRVIESLERVVRTVPDVEYHVVGGGIDGQYQRQVEGISRNLDVADRVYFEGRVSEMELPSGSRRLTRSSCSHNMSTTVSRGSVSSIWKLISMVFPRWA
ncbi:glycosyltransferase family 4 protein [Halomicroarcula sp. GCM10025709]|uniref:glycosyltransferase family 4 protein n=1 Tax=Halomicroarcula sp. GCM10025709 TaxID=3252669 RepID=UPI003610619E